MASKSPSQQLSKIVIDDEDSDIQSMDQDVDQSASKKSMAPEKYDAKKIIERPPTSELWDKARKDIRAAMGNKKGGIIKATASKRADGIAQRGKTKGRIV